MEVVAGCHGTAISLLPCLSANSHRHIPRSSPFYFIFRRRLPNACRSLKHRSARRRIASLALSSAQDVPVGPLIPEPTEEDLECVRQIKRVLELLKKNRDMLFSEVKLTIMIEDPRDAERRQKDPDYVPREELAVALEDVNDGRVPENRMVLYKLAEEMMQWPNLEVETTTKKKPLKSLYAKVTDTGIDPALAAKRANIDWDTAAELESPDEKDETEVPPAVGYGVLYLVTGLPVIIGVSVVLILFYNSLQ